MHYVPQVATLIDHMYGTVAQTPEVQAVMKPSSQRLLLHNSSQAKKTNFTEMRHKAVTNK